MKKVKEIKCVDRERYASGQALEEARAQFPHEQDVIYQLKVWYHATARPRYPKFRLSDGERYLFRTLADAERQVAKIVAAEKADRELPSGRKNVAVPYCFLVEEIPLGRPQWRSESQAWWRYDGTGRLVVSSLVSEMDHDGELEAFFGRSSKSCPVRHGDIVEVMYGEEVVLEIVCHLPPDPISVMRMYAGKGGTQQSPDGAARQHLLDFTDDSYTTLDGSVTEGQDTYMHAHSHPHTKQVFPAGRKVPERVRSRLEACLRRVEAELDERMTEVYGPFYGFIKRVNNGTLNEDYIYDRYFSMQTPYEQAKMIVDECIEMVDDQEIYDFPEDLYNTFKKNLGVIRQAIGSEELTPRQKIYFRECLKNGKKAFSEVSILNVITFK